MAILNFPTATTSSFFVPPTHECSMKFGTFQPSSFKVNNLLFLIFVKESENLRDSVSIQATVQQFLFCSCGEFGKTSNTVF